MRVSQSLGLLSLLFFIVNCSRVNEEEIEQEEVFEQIDDELEAVTLATDVEWEAGEGDPRASLLTGRWALKIVSSTISESVGGLGETLTEGETWFLVERDYDAATNQYVETQQLCGGIQYEARGTQSTMPTETYQSLPLNDLSDVTIDIDAGEYTLNNLVELWGINMPDPFSDNFPSSREEAEMEPYASQIYDMDGDEEHGVAINVSGIWNGTLHFIRQKNTRLNGRLIQDPDSKRVYIFGLTEHITRRDLNLRAEGPGSGLIPERVDYWQNTDARKNFFESIRLDSTDDCEAVNEAVADSHLFCDQNPYISGAASLNCYINQLVGETETQDEA